MKNPITTKDLGVLNELMMFEQWASTKFRFHYDCLKDLGGHEELEELFEQISIEHGERFDELFKYYKANMNAGGAK